MNSKHPGPVSLLLVIERRCHRDKFWIYVSPWRRAWFNNLGTRNSVIEPSGTNCHWGMLKFNCSSAVCWYKKSSIGMHSVCVSFCCRESNQDGKECDYLFNHMGLQIMIKSVSETFPTTEVGDRTTQSRWYPVWYYLISLFLVSAQNKT